MLEMLERWKKKLGRQEEPRPEALEEERLVSCLMQAMVRALADSAKKKIAVQGSFRTLRVDGSYPGSTDGDKAIVRLTIARRESRREAYALLMGIRRDPAEREARVISDQIYTAPIVELLGWMQDEEGLDILRENVLQLHRQLSELDEDPASFIR